MNLSQFKKNFKSFKSLTLVDSNLFDIGDSKHKLLHLERDVALINSVGFALWTINREGKRVKSYMSWPKASEFEYLSTPEGDGFTIRIEDKYRPEGFYFFTYRITFKALCEVCHGETGEDVERLGLCHSCLQAEAQLVD